MSAQVEGSKQGILAHAASLDPINRLYYLEVLQSKTATEELVFLDSEHNVNATPEINEWLKDLLRTEAIPEGYFDFCIQKMMSQVHPIMRADFKRGLADSLGNLTLEEASNHGTMEGFSAEQIPLLYIQMQTWVAEQQRPAAANLN